MAWPYVLLGVGAAGWASLWPLTRHGFVPAGWVQTAYEATRRGPHGAAMQDGPGVAAFVAAQALLHQATPSAADIAWLRARIDEQEMLTPAALAALGLVAQARDDLEEARAFLDAVRYFEDRVTDPSVRSVAAEWLLAEAATRGAWEEVLQLGGAHQVQSRMGRLLVGMARRLLGRPNAPSMYLLEGLRDALPDGQRPPEALWRQLGGAPYAPADRDGASTAHDDPLHAALLATVALERDPSLVLTVDGQDGRWLEEDEWVRVARGGTPLHLHARVPGRFLPDDGDVFSLDLDPAQVFVFPTEGPISGDEPEPSRTEERASGDAVAPVRK